MSKVNILNERSFEKLNSFLPNKIPKHHNYIKTYLFPLVDILVQLYIDADLNEDFHSISNFKKLLSEYKKKNFLFDYSEENIIEEGWIATFLDRWEFNGNSCSFKRLEFDKVDNYNMILFLNWLLEQENQSRSCIIIKNLDETLEKWRKLYPKTPNSEWFIENRFIFRENGVYYADSYYIEDTAVCEALAKIWIYYVNYEEKNDVDRWFKIARQLRATSKILKYFEYKDKRVFLEKLIELFIAEKYIINSKREEKRIEKQYWLENSKYFREKREIKLFSSNFLVEKLNYYDRNIFEQSSSLHIRDEDINFVIDCLIKYLDILPDNCYKKVIPALCNLHECGIFNYFTFHSTEVFMKLCSYEDTQFIGLQLLLNLAISNNMQSPEQFISCFIELFRNIINSSGTYESGVNSNALAQLLHLCSEKGLNWSKSMNMTSRVYKLLITRMINELAKFPFQLKKMLPNILNFFVDLCKQKNDVLWCHAFHLVNMCINSWYYGDYALDKDENYIRMQNLLIECYNSIFECTLSQKKANFVSEEFLFDNVWIDIYDEQISKSLDKQIEFLKPININRVLDDSITNYNDKENIKFNLRHKFRINLTMLSIILHGNNKAMELEKSILVNILTSLKNDNEDLFDYSHINIFECEDVMKKCVSLINLEEDVYQKLIKQLDEYSVPKLLLFLHYSNNDKLSQKLHELIIKKVEPKCIEVYGNDQAISLALKYKIKELYPHIEKLLKSYLERIKDKKGLAIDNNRSKIDSQLNQLFYCWQRYEEILDGTNLFYKALVYVESDKYRDFDKAEAIGYELIHNEETDYPGAYINLVYTHLMQLKIAIKDGDENLTDKIRRKIFKLSGKIENEKIADWNLEQKKCYCSNIIYVMQLLGNDIKEYINELNKNFDLDLDFEEYEKEKASTVTENISIDNYENLKKYLWKYMNMNPKDKSKIHYELKSIENLHDADETLLLECIIKTCYAIEAYGPQLAVGQSKSKNANKVDEDENELDIEWKYYEDYITQLYREMFNLAFTSVHKFAINDQEQTGSTGKAVHNGKKKGSSEIDLTIKRDNIKMGILEALVLERYNRNQIKDHICKAIGNNIQHSTVSVVLIYGTSEKSSELFLKYRRYIDSEMSQILNDEGYIVEPVIEFNKTPFYNEKVFGDIPLTDKIIYQQFRNPNGMDQHLYHIYLDLSKDSEIRIRLIGDS